MFEVPLTVANFDAKLRSKLLEACKFNWSGISRAIYGPVFKSVMERYECRSTGALHAIENSMMKVIRPLFLDDLMDEAERLCYRTRKRNHQLVVTTGDDHS